MTNTMETLKRWRSFLLNPDSYHNLCVCYPPSLSAQNYATVHEKLLTEMLGNSVQNHPDILLITTDKAALQVSDLDPMDDFIKARSNQLPCKIIVLLGPAPFSNTISNKLLKVLEDPPIALSFLALGHLPNLFLPTVRSRFLTWRLTSADLSTLGQEISTQLEQEQLQALRQVTSAQDLEQWADSYHLEESSCYELIWKLSLPQYGKAQELERHLSLGRWLETSLTWKNSPQERWYFLFQLIKNKLNSATAG